jgi:signal transduction histidine kinase
VQDVTEKKLAETERALMLNDLVQRNKDLEQFAYIVSHNLRAPVANILGATNGLNYPGLSIDNKNILTQGLKESVVKLDDVVKDLNHILQLKREISSIKQNVRFSRLVDDIKITIKNMINDNNIEIKYDFSEIDEFLSFKSYLYSIFYNLISNSIKYRQQQIHCIIRIKSHLIRDKVQLIFTDNGMGIDLEKRGSQVFGLYKRFHNNIEGKGMGLFMVKTQVETLGGKINICSQVNKGTEFKIEFQI